MGKDNIDKVFRAFIYVLPAVLYFSYFPVIRLGANETMNFELSLPLIWLVLFDLFSFVILVRKRLFSKFFKNWTWLLFPVFITLSIIWSANVVRGILTTGILWLIYFAIFAFLKLQKEVLGDKYKKIFWKWFFCSSLLACAWCWLQCILDIVGLPRDCTLLCAGCTYKMFGFPHPNGFAIEPQFMGNLLLAPALVSGWLILRNTVLLKHYIIVLFVVVATLFLTFSRGAIYAFVVAMIFMSVFVILQERKKRRNVIRMVGLVWGVLALSFVFTLNMQGIFSQFSKTNDTYISGIAKVLNQLSLGVVDIRTNSKEFIEGEIEKEDGIEKVDTSDEAVFDGYVAESTDTRVRLTRAALKIWQKDFKNAMIGVGIGGAGQALYDNDLSPAPKEIVQNEYVSLLMELGVVGVLLFVLTVVLIIRVVIKSSYAGIFLTLVVAYGVTLCFFSGLPNALHIYLLPAVLAMLFTNKE